MSWVPRASSMQTGERQSASEAVGYARAVEAGVQRPHHLDQLGHRGPAELPPTEFAVLPEGERECEFEGPRANSSPFVPLLLLDPAVCRRTSCSSRVKPARGRCPSERVDREALRGRFRMPTTWLVKYRLASPSSRSVRPDRSRHSRTTLAASTRTRSSDQITDDDYARSVRRDAVPPGRRRACGPAHPRQGPRPSATMSAESKWACWSAQSLRSPTTR